MKKHHSQILIFILVMIYFNCNGQGKILYHEFEPTASDFRITKWNINKEKLPYYYLIEKVDFKNRVTELKFYENGQFYVDHLCYLTTWIKYEYPNAQTIIQTNLNEKGIPEANIECLIPSKTTYHLSKNQREIINSKDEFTFDHTPYLKNNWTEKEIGEVIEELKSEEQTASVIDYYSMSFYKLNNIFPVDNKFDISTFYFNELEKEKIISGLK
ncbi:hypothetical protein [Formosa sp. PL04]|uniref:hypothetical protein n=1 Tax=Formosa sp. PL04 TaxID=3081755 RepID=UPI00298269C0|nr:hypothetical protein [Formosa sp. PL04]MDW5290436.1 hypothetical protein [Formosa sp. PL04]